jgi:DNA mismatch endonuclease, patch repair protein
MRAVRGKNTKPELIVRRMLHALGFRFRLHDRRLPGSPDLVLRRHRAVVLVHGCFWHGHEGCRRSRMPSTNVEFWINKLKRNAERDASQVERLTAGGWRVLVVWECQTRDAEALKALLLDFFAPQRPST